MEIEKKFLIKKLPEQPEAYPHHKIEQAYLSTEPVLRIRQKDDRYILTYKGQGMMVREEHEFPLTKEAYAHLLEKADGNIITKTRYLIPDGKHTIELDVFSGCFEGLIMAEVEFASVEEADGYQIPDWFLKEVTTDSRFHNSVMSRMSEDDRAAFLTALRSDRPE